MAKFYHISSELALFYNICYNFKQVVPLNSGFKGDLWPREY